MPWAKAHGVKFSPPKYQLCHFTRKRRPHPYTLNINDGTIVEPREVVRYLGVDLDKKLSWKTQVNSNKTRALKTVGALASLSGSV